MATNIAEGKRRRPAAGRSAGPPPDGASPSDASGNVRAQGNLSGLAARLGLDPQALLEQLTSGSAVASSTSRWSAGASVDGGVIVDAYA